MSKAREATVVGVAVLLADLGLRFFNLQQPRFRIIADLYPDQLFPLAGGWAIAVVLLLLVYIRVASVGRNTRFAGFCIGVILGETLARYALLPLMSANSL